MRDSGAVDDLVEQALRTIERPYPRDVTDRVCQAIESHPAWLPIYNDLVAASSTHAVNSAIGRTTLQLTGLESQGVHRAARSTLIKTYTELGRGPRSE